MERKFIASLCSTNQNRGHDILHVFSSKRAVESLLIEAFGHNMLHGNFQFMGKITHAQVGRLPRDPERVACSSILRLKICTGGNRTCHLFPFRLPLLILSFGGTLEALQGIIYAGSDCFRAKCFEKPTPPAWWEDEVSAILDATGGRIAGIAGNVRLLLQSTWKKSMHAELVSFGIDLFDLEDEVPGAAKGFSREVDGLAYGG